MAERIVKRRGYREGVPGEMLAEFLGTFVLLLLGIGSVAVAVVGLPGSGRQAVDFGPANWLIISWGWGLAVVFGVYARLVGWGFVLVWVCVGRGGCARVVDGVGAWAVEGEGAAA